MNYFHITNNVKISTLVSVNLSANDWQLSTVDFPRPVIESVATLLNKRYNNGYNRGMSKCQLATHMQDLMNSMSAYGADGTGARDVLEGLLGKTYP